MDIVKKYKGHIFFDVVVMIIIGAFLYGLFQYNQIQKPMLVQTGGRTFERATVVQVLADNLQENNNRIGDQQVLLHIDTGDMRNQIVEANSPNGFLFGAVCKPGLSVIAIVSTVDTIHTVTVYSVDRTIPIYGFILFFLVDLCIIGGKKGIRSAIALLFTFFCIIYLFLPMVFRGVSPLTAAVLTSTIAVSATIFLVCGKNVKSASAILGTACGLLITGGAAIIFGELTTISGYNVSNIEALIFVRENTAINIGELLFAGVLIASLGAVMDVAMDISSAMYEIRQQIPNITRKKLFSSGMNVGRDIMGTMSTTLILAFFGGSMGIWVLNYVYDLPYLQLLNSNAVGIEVMQGISGSLGVIFTVPMVAAISAYMMNKYK